VIVTGRWRSRRGTTSILVTLDGAGVEEMFGGLHLDSRSVSRGAGLTSAQHQLHAAVARRS
jgi:hypothetical protein